MMAKKARSPENERLDFRNLDLLGGIAWLHAGELAGNEVFT
jgi:hypothetical protein